MIQALQQPVSFDEFNSWYPEQSEFRYELKRGVIVQMPKPKGQHSVLAGNTATDLTLQIRQQGWPYVVPKECIVKISEDTGYEPDIIVLDNDCLTTEPRWESASTVERGASIKLIVEVVSTNWRDDYVVKLADYEAMGIQEYWVMDYLGLGGRRFIGNPKQPTLTICTLIDGEYEMTLFQGDTPIISPTFPGLNLTAAKLLGAERPAKPDHLPEQE